LKHTISDRIGIKRKKEKKKGKERKRGSHEDAAEQQKRKGKEQRYIGRNRWPLTRKLLAHL
jgi:hypothetical protein